MPTSLRLYNLPIVMNTLTLYRSVPAYHVPPSCLSLCPSNHRHCPMVHVYSYRRVSSTRAMPALFFEWSEPPIARAYNGCVRLLIPLFIYHRISHLRPPPSPYPTLSISDPPTMERVPTTPPRHRRLLSTPAPVTVQPSPPRRSELPPCGIEARRRLIRAAQAGMGLTDEEDFSPEYLASWLDPDVEDATYFRMRKEEGAWYSVVHRRGDC